MRIIAFLIMFFLLVFCSACGQKEELPQITYEQFEDYRTKYYAGLQYQQALREDRPIVLIFAQPGDVFSIFRVTPLAKFLTDEFNGKYNCVIINMEYGVKGTFDKYIHRWDEKDYKYNKKLAEGFKIVEYPALFLVNPTTRTYIPVKKEDYVEEEQLRNIMNEYLERCEATSQR